MKAAPRRSPDDMGLPVFHLSFPVRDLAAAKAFYCGVLGARVGRDNEKWVDILLFGHQLTLHQRPDQVPAPDQRGVRHFGAILPWPAWEALAKEIEAAGAEFSSPPTVSFAGTPREQGKLLLCDPSDNLIELKAYRNVHAAFGTEPTPPLSATHGLPHFARPSKQSLGLVSLVVRDYDEAIAFFVGTLGFDLVEDRFVPEQSKRWVVVSPPGAVESRLLLARASSPGQEARIGDQSGGRVFLFLYTDDITRDYAVYRSRGVRFVREPKEEPYGTVAVFLDLYGNQWDLLQVAHAEPSGRIMRPTDAMGA